MPVASSTTDDASDWVVAEKLGFSRLGTTFRSMSEHNVAMASYVTHSPPVPAELSSSTSSSSGMNLAEGEPCMATACFCYDSSSNTVAVWSSSNAENTKLMRLSGHPSAVVGLRLAEPFVITYTSNAMHVWCTIPLLAHLQRLEADDRRAVIASRDLSPSAPDATDSATAVAIDVDEPLARIEFTRSLTAIGMNSSLVLTGHKNGDIVVWQLPAAITDDATAAAIEAIEPSRRVSPLRTLSGHTGEVRHVCIQQDSEFATSTCADLKLRVWCLASGQCLYELDELMSVPLLHVTPFSIVLCDAAEIVLYDYLRIAPRPKRAVDLPPNPASTSSSSSSSADTTPQRASRLAAWLPASVSSAKAHGDDDDVELHVASSHQVGAASDDDSDDDADADKLADADADDDDEKEFAVRLGNERLCGIPLSSVFRSGCYWTSAAATAGVVGVILLCILGAATYLGIEVTPYDSPWSMVLNIMIWFVWIIYMLIVLAIPLSICILPITAVAVCLFLCYLNLYKENRAASRRDLEETGDSVVVDL